VGGYLFVCLCVFCGRCGNVREVLKEIDASVFMPVNGWILLMGDACFIQWNILQFCYRFRVSLDCMCVHVCVRVTE
jgi:hypothetical protein